MGTGLAVWRERPGEAALEAHYAYWVGVKTAIQPHLPRLLNIAIGCQVAQEFGVKRGASSSALMQGAASLISYDLVETREARWLSDHVGERWSYRIQDSREAPITPCDLLFIDSEHTYAHLRAELDRHADSVRRWLIFHDTITFGSVGAKGETGRALWTYEPGLPVPSDALGIRPAIDELMIRDPSWQIAAHYTDSHGLLVLERR